MENFRMNTFIEGIISILPWAATLLVIKTVKMKKIDHELKTLEQLGEKSIDENNYIIKEERWLSILFSIVQY